MEMLNKILVLMANNVEFTMFAVSFVLAPIVVLCICKGTYETTGPDKPGEPYYEERRAARAARAARAPRMEEAKNPPPMPPVEEPKQEPVKVLGDKVQLSIEFN